MPEADAEGGLVFWAVAPSTNKCPGSLILPKSIGSYTRYMSRLQRVLSRSPPKDGDPALPARPFRYPPAKKKERPACRRQGEDGRRARVARCPPSSAGGRRVLEAL